VRTTLLRVLALLLATMPAAVPASAQEIPLEYRIKAAYLYNFVKFVEWPARASTGPIVICVGGKNPFGDVLAETLRGETVNGRSLQARVILEPDPGCHVLFVPEGANAGAYLRAAKGTPTLTVGEAPDYLDQGGIIRFFVEEGNVRFEIDSDAALQHELTISSRLLRLGRRATNRGSTR
jgi:hypothetical protein